MLSEGVDKSQPDTEHLQGETPKLPVGNAESPGIGQARPTQRGAGTELGLEPGGNRVESTPRGAVME